MLSPGLPSDETLFTQLKSKSRAWLSLMRILLVLMDHCANSTNQTSFTPGRIRIRRHRSRT